MGLMGRLRRLDQRVVPRLARGYDRIAAAARSWRPRPLTVVALVLVAAVAATLVWRSVRPDGTSTGATGSGGSTVRVGVADGDSIPRYVADSRAELDRLATGSVETPVYALVSLGAYLAPDRVAALAAGDRDLSTISAYARVPLKHRQTELVRLRAVKLPDDLATAMREVADRKAKDAAEHARLAEAETDPQRREVYRSGAEVDAAEAAAYRTGCDCVFALVVRAVPAALVRLGQHRDVRVIDAAPEVTRVDRAVFAPPLPEQEDVVAPPVDEDQTVPGD